jgi:hypothetical protein
MISGIFIGRIEIAPISQWAGRGFFIFNSIKGE